MNSDLDPRQRLLGAVIGISLCAGYAAAAVGAALAWPWVVVAGLVAIHLAESPAEASVWVRPVLRRAQMPPAARSVLRDILVVVLVATATWGHGHDARNLVGAMGVVVIARFTVLVVHVIARRRVLPAVEVRNLDVPRVAGADVPRWLYDDEAPLRLHHLTAVAAFGAALAVALRNYSLGLVTTLVTDGALALVFCVIAYHLVRSRRQPREQYRLAVEHAVDALAPRIMLFFSGDRDSTYQLNMWLTTFERLGEPCVVVLRQRIHLEQMPPTSLPILCVPGAVDFMAFGWATIRVAAYVANVGNNIHMLRERGVRHVFIGHGDSDKTGSFSPYSKVYSEVWVAGPAGRERYLRARIGIRDEEMIEVGRPQLVGLSRGSGRYDDGELTVLYAPTWEGWPGDPPHSSLAAAGERMVQGLLSTPGVRVLYKPHPLTGTVSADARAAHERVVAMVTAAGGGHRVVTGSSPTLYECFNDADVLVGDISSVVSDFLASEKPYVMANLHAMPDEEFRREFPSAAAAYLLAADGSGIEAAVEQIRGGDPLAAQRRTTREHLLGRSAPGDLTPFVRAIDEAAAAAEALRAPAGARG